MTGSPLFTAEQIHFPIIAVGHPKFDHLLMTVGMFLHLKSSSNPYYLNNRTSKTCDAAKLLFASNFALPKDRRPQVVKNERHLGKSWLWNCLLISVILDTNLKIR
uniref:Uncharacterized protein n=1 Tax=Schistocephalus solidus TaxID=70667 RepID=A0A0V0J9S1_SCHSO